MKLLSSLLISYKATAMRLLRKSKIILHITHCNTLNNFRHSLIANKAHICFSICIYIFHVGTIKRLIKTS